MTRAFRLSDSTLKQLHTCERLFQLERILSAGSAKSYYPATVLGTSFGIGVASYFTYQDKEKALWDAWLSYYPKEEDQVRTQSVCMNMLERSFPVIDNLLQDWGVAVFQGKPAIELSFRLDVDSSYYFVGYIDLVLRNRWTGRHAVVDAKSTGLKLFDLSPVYQNSPQGIGYSIVLDQIVGEELAEYDVAYFSGQLGSGNGFEPAVKFLVYPKTLQDRLQWFISLGLDVNHLREMASLGIYPQRGHNCLQYNKPCKNFGTCSLVGFDREVEQVEDTEEYQFRFSLDTLVENHLRRISA